MIERIKQLFSSPVTALSGADPEAIVRETTAALLVEIMITDGLIEDSEEAKITQLLQHQFRVTPQEAEELFALAKIAVKDATSLYPLTSGVNQSFSADQKLDLLCQLWQVAYADGILDKYEEGVMRHIAELLHIPHSQFLKARNLARCSR